MILQLQGEFLLEGFPGWDNAAPLALLQHSPVPVIGPHHAKEDPILEVETWDMMLGAWEEACVVPRGHHVYGDASLSPDPTMTGMHSHGKG